MKASQRSWFSQCSLGPVTVSTPTSWFGRTVRELHTHHDSATLTEICTEPLLSRRYNHHYQCRVRERACPLATDAVLRNRSVEKPPDHSVYLGQTAVCDLSKHDKEQGKWCEKQRGWRRERQTVVRKPWGEWCGFTAGHSDCVRTPNLLLSLTENQGKKEKVAGLIPTSS